MGKAFGVVYSFVSLGGLSGPAAAGILLEIAGYWATWIVSLLVISTDIVMRLLMLEQPTKSKTETGVDRPHGESDTTPDDSSPLLPEDGRQSYDTIISKPVGRKTGVSVLTFYKLMLGRKRVLVALACNTMYSAMIASYSTTIPVHVMAVFGWGSLPTGLLFVGLQGPIILFGPLFGWLRDKVGTRLPAGSGFLLLAPLIWLLGAAAEPRFPWAHTSSSAKHTYIGAIIGIGCVTNLMSGVGAIEITSEPDPGVFRTRDFFSWS
jgi:MFS family permease